MLDQPIAVSKRDHRVLWPEHELHKTRKHCIGTTAPKDSVVVEGISDEGCSPPVKAHNPNYRLRENSINILGAQSTKEVTILVHPHCHTFNIVVTYPKVTPCSSKGKLNRNVKKFAKVTLPVHLYTIFMHALFTFDPIKQQNPTCCHCEGKGTHKMRHTIAKTCLRYSVGNNPTHPFFGQRRESRIMYVLHVEINQFVQNRPSRGTNRGTPS
mmetsp:Transcript_82225/g.220693  ORF Transcript_82225/g.220693 Transcript_82225/m.220693 type:complete len:212 (-) Transcript_82225:330-965(-)